MRASILVFLLGALSLPVCATADLLSLAAEGFRHEELRKALSDLPAEINVRDGEGQTALHWSARRGQFEDVLLLLLAGADANAVDTSGRTPLFRVLERSGSDAMLMLELLTFAGADVNRIAADGTTPLAVAVRGSDAAAVEFLLWRGAALEPAGAPAALQPAMIARQMQNREMIALLEAARALAPASSAVPRPLGDEIKRRFFAVARAADLNSVAALLADGVAVNERDADGATALYRAVSDHRPDLVTLLLFEGADPNLATAAGKTPLMASAAFMDMAGTRSTLLLLLAGAEVGTATKEGRTALSEAVVRRNNFAAKWCIWRGASLDVRTPGGSLMQLAKARPDWPSMIELLKNLGVREDEPLAGPPEKGLFDAVRAGDLDRVRGELARGVSATCTDEGGCHPLAWAAHYGQFAIVDLLLAHGADVDQPNRKTSKTTLQELALWGRGSGDASVAADHMKNLLARGADPDLLTSDGLTALMIAARTGTTGPNFSLLLKITKDVNARSKAGQTALGLAREYGHAEVARELIARGAVE